MTVTNVLEKNSSELHSQEITATTTVGSTLIEHSYENCLEHEFWVAFTGTVRNMRSGTFIREWETGGGWWQQVSS